MILRWALGFECIRSLRFRFRDVQDYVLMPQPTPADHDPDAAQTEKPGLKDAQEASVPGPSYVVVFRSLVISVRSTNYLSDKPRQTLIRGSFQESLDDG